MVRDGDADHPVRTWVVVLLSILLVAELGGLVAVSRWQGRHREDKFDRLYDPPSPLPVREAGTPIRVWELSGDGIAGKVYGMLYHSRSEQGHDIAVSGYLAIPDVPPPEGGYPIVAVAHGTVGGAADCAPSREPAANGATIDPFLKKGWMVAATDFEGIGGPGRHPYLVGVSEARSVIDSVRAARSLAGESVTSDRYVVWGISQGGHAALFTGQISARWAPELNLLGAVALAPVSDVAAFISAPTIAPQAVTLLAVSGYTAAYPRLRADQILTPTGLDHLGDVGLHCLLQVNERLSKSPLSTYRRRDPVDVSGWRDAIIANTPGAVESPVPVLLLQGNRDPIVPLAQTRALFRKLCQRGDVARIQVVDGASHGDVTGLGRSDYLLWMSARFTNSAAVSACPADD